MITNMRPNHRVGKMAPCSMAARYYRVFKNRIKPMVLFCGNKYATSNIRKYFLNMYSPNSEKARMGPPKISGKTQRNLPSYEETIFRTLIAAKESPFSAPFGYFPRGPDFYPKFGKTSYAIISQQRGHFGDTWVGQDFPKILGKS